MFFAKKWPIKKKERYLAIFSRVKIASQDEWEIRWRLVVSPDRQRISHRKGAAIGAGSGREKLGAVKLEKKGGEEEFLLWRSE